MVQFKCAKCGHLSYEVGQFQATGGMMSKMFDIQTEKFQTVSCQRCGYTEIYKQRTSTGENLLDMFFN